MVGYQFHLRGKVLLAIALALFVTACSGSGTTGPAAQRLYRLVTIPRVRGELQSSAVRKIMHRGLRRPKEEYKFNLSLSPGYAIATKPSSGTRVRTNYTVALLISSGPPPCSGCEMTRVMPNVCGLTFQQANTLLAENDITLNPHAIHQSSSEPPGTIIWSVPTAGTSFTAYGGPAAKEVIVTISSGQTTSPAQTPSGGSQNTCSPPSPSPSSP